MRIYELSNKIDIKSFSLFDTKDSSSSTHVNETTNCYSFGTGGRDFMNVNQIS